MSGARRPGRAAISLARGDPESAGPIGIVVGERENAANHEVSRVSEHDPPSGDRLTRWSWPSRPRPSFLRRSPSSGSVQARASGATNVPVVRYLDDGPDILSGVVGGDCSSMASRSW